MGPIDLPSSDRSVSVLFRRAAGGWTWFAPGTGLGASNGRGGPDAEYWRQLLDVDVDGDARAEPAGQGRIRVGAALKCKN
jgi:hypothetical protein